MSTLSRRKFLLGAAGVLGAAVVGDGCSLEPHTVDVSRHDLTVPGLAPALDGLRIAQCTDLHLQGALRPPARSTLAVLAAERPDVVFFTGDMVNRRRKLPELVAWARDARGTLATFATFGNWEYYAGLDRATAEAAYHKVGVQLLFNSAATVHVRGATLTVLGLDDPVRGTPDLAATFAGVRDGDTSVLALHAPGYVDRIPREAFPAPSLILAGHTHGGQIRLPGWTPYTPSGSGRFVSGWYRDTIAPLYVSRGIGTIVVPIRMFCPPELPVITLRAA